jgi:hypothetical protein
MNVPLLAASDYGITVAIGFLLVFFLIVAWVIVQGTRAQLAWRAQVDAGDVSAIQTLVGDELTRWKTARMPKGVAPGLWHGVQSAELIEVKPEGVRITASAEGQYALVGGDRREVTSALNEAFALTARLADMVMYDIPNVKLPYAQVDIYSTFRDETGAAQRCIMSTLCEREVADVIDWDEIGPEQIVRAFGGRFSLDDRGNPNPISPDATAGSGVPAVFYKD